MPLYRNYLLSILILSLAFNNMDRTVVGLVLQSIKADLHLSDTQLGLITGIAFGAFYALMGIPLARWADRGNRITIVVLTTALWSVAMALCGLVTNFVQLIAVRVMAAVGEAGCIPTAQSLIGDHFDRAERPRATARFMLGTPISILLGNFVAGWVNELYGWRATFLIMGIPGIVLAVLAWITLKEPRYEIDTKQGPRGSTLHRSVPAASLDLSETFTVLWRNLTFRRLLIALSMLFFFLWGIQQWQPAFFIRSFNLQTGELGTWFTLIGGICGFLGTYWGGELASRYAAGNEPRQLKAMAIAYGFYALVSIAAYSSTSKYWAFGLMALAAIGYMLTWGPMFALLQSLVPTRMRATAMALVFLFANLIGMGLGPLAAGMLSDALRPLYGEESLRYALLILWPGFLIPAWFVWRANQTVAQDLKNVPDDEALYEGQFPGDVCDKGSSASCQ
jgi:MFS family permease